MKENDLEAGQALERAEKAIEHAEYWLQRVIDNEHAPSSIRLRAIDYLARLADMNTEMNKRKQ